MRLNPNTKLGSLLVAIPSASGVCDGFHIAISGNEGKTLEEVCAETGITLASFLEALDHIDWENEYRPEGAAPYDD
jgi:hypothetical protein